MLELNNLIDVLLKFENEIYSEEINKNMKEHGQRHILDVLLYSIIIGESLLNEHDLNLLLIAAKYHDVGRTEENGFFEIRWTQQNVFVINLLNINLKFLKNDLVFLSFKK